MRSRTARFLLAGALAAFLLYTQAANAQTIYLTQRHFNAIKSKVNAGAEPWASAYPIVLKEASNALRGEFQSVTDNGAPLNSSDRHLFGNDKTYSTDGIPNTRSDRRDAHAYYNMSEWAADLGLAYAFTGDDRYARRAIDILYAWCVDSRTFMRPVSWDNGPTQLHFGSGGAVSIFIATPALVQGAALVAGHPYWESKGRGTEAKVRQWMRDLLESTNKLGWDGRNFKSEWIHQRAALAAYLGDEGELEQVFKDWRSHISYLESGNGHLPFEGRRTRGMHYTYNAMRHLTRAAIIAANYGEDLHNYDDGEGSGGLKGEPVLKRLYLYNAKYVLDNNMPRLWEADGRQEIGPIEGFWRAIYEMGYSEWQEPVFKQIIDKGGRPLAGSRDYPLTLLFGEAHRLSVPDTGDDSNDGSDDGDSGDDPSDGGDPGDESGDDADDDPPVRSQDVEDTYVRDGDYRNENFADSQILKVKDDKSSGYTREAYLAFDLSGSSSIEQAVIRLHPIAMGSEDQVHEMAIVDPNWKASELTWTRRPASQEVIGRWTVRYGRTVELDVTKLAEAARSRDGVLAVRIYRVGSGGGDNWVNYASTEHRNASLRPQLTVGTRSGNEDESKGTEDTAILEAAADGWVRAGSYANESFGSTPLLYVKHGKDDDYTREAFVRFDLSGIDGTPKAALLRLHAAKAGRDGQTQELLLVNGGAWSEKSLSWANRPPSSEVLATWTIAAGQDVEIDVTDAVKKAIEGDGRLSVQVRRPNAGGTDNWVKYASREYSDESKRPTLEVALGTPTRVQNIPTDTESSSVPEAVVLEQNYPNPFNPTTNIAYQLSEPARVSLRVFDVTGRLVSVLVDGHQAAGRHEVRWEARDASGRSLPSGVYVYQLTVGSQQISRAMLSMK